MLPPKITVTAGESHKAPGRDPRFELFRHFLAVSRPRMCQRVHRNAQETAVDIGRHQLERLKQADGLDKPK
jgi:hypothetical protein